MGQRHVSIDTRTNVAAYARQLGGHIYNTKVIGKPRVIVATLF